MESTNNRPHFFDLKIPLGSLLGFYGLLLFGYGLLGPREIYGKSLGMNINLVWGIIMIVVGGIFLGVSYAKRNGKRQ
ncbi:MAG TPA: hypothetical protein VIS48_02340 [Candidatus Kryptonia bacterium]